MAITGTLSKSFIYLFLPALVVCLSSLLSANPIQKLWQLTQLAKHGIFDQHSAAPGHSCTHEYTVEILSFDPAVLYLNNFIKEHEIEHLLNITKNEFEQSWVYDKDLKSVIDKNYRTSSSAMVPWEDPVALCLSDRMKSFLGNIQHIDVEPLQIVKYEGGERFRLHMDWFRETRNETYIEERRFRPYNRLGSIFVYLEGNCTGGETYFPDIKGVSASADGEKFAKTDTGTGLLVKPKRGNAVFWNNMLANGTGDPRVLHAGLPVKSGVKIGMNMFSYYYLDAPLVGGD